MTEKYRKTIFVIQIILALSVALYIGCGNNPIINPPKTDIVLSTGDAFIDPNVVAEYPQPLITDLNTYPYPPSCTLTGSFPAPLNQGSLGACVAFSIAYGMRTAFANLQWDTDITNANYQCSPMWFYKQCLIDQNKSWGSGLNIIDAMNLMVKNGTNSLQVSPYNPPVTEESISTEPIDNYKYRIDSFKTIDIKDRNMIKYMLCNNTPLICSIKVRKNLFEYKGGIYKATGDYYYDGWNIFTPSRHAMVICGYDEPNAFYRVFNSWGSLWGEGGYLLLDVSSFELDGNLVACPSQSSFNAMPQEEYVHWNDSLEGKVDSFQQLDNSGYHYLYMTFHFNQPCLLKSISVKKDNITFAQKYNLWYKKGDLYFYQTEPFPGGTYLYTFYVEDANGMVQEIKETVTLPVTKDKGAKISSGIYGMNKKSVIY